MQENVLENAIAEVKLLEHISYREWLEALYNYGKTTVKSYSYLRFAEELGLGPTNIAYMVIQGKRKLTLKAAKRIVKTAPLSHSEKRYLLNLVCHNNAKEQGKRDKYFKALLLLRKNSLDTPEGQLKLEFFSEWYHAVIFEMLGLAQSNSDPDWILSRITAPLSKDQVQKSLALLERIGCIHRNQETGHFEKAAQDFDVGNSIPGMAIIRFHQSMIELAKDALVRLDAEERNVNTVTFSTSKENAEKIKKMVEDFARFLMHVANSSTEKDRVMQLNIQLFPLTR